MIKIFLNKNIKKILRICTFYSIVKDDQLYIFYLLIFKFINYYSINSNLAIQIISSINHNLGDHFYQLMVLHFLKPMQNLT